MNFSTNKRKIINDPVYGFINITSELVFDLLEHPYFQRLRRIRQLGLTNFVYPAANHSRFQHALGTVHLMGMAIDTIRSKGHEITENEAEAVTIAILLHDVGHGPFSHALEQTIIENFSHESLSLLIMQKLNIEFNGQMQTAIDIFQNKYPKRFLHQLVSSQLDMDRLDYLNRDSFFTGVHEGVIGSDRIIKMINIVNDQLVIEAKGIYSIEKFLIARRLMYWQVYLHKTVLAAENLLVNVLLRARQLAIKGEELFATPALKYFLYHLNISKIKDSKEMQDEMLTHFVNLDDYDVVACCKVWTGHSDRALSMLCDNLINRKLYRVELQNAAFDEVKVQALKTKCMSQLGLTSEEAEYFVFSRSISNHAYNVRDDDKIKILFNNGTLVDISEASDMLNLSVLSKIVKKHFICYPKGLNI